MTRRSGSEGSRSACEKRERHRARCVGRGRSLLLIAATRRTRGRALAAALGAGLMARGVSGYCPITAAARRERNRDDTRTALGGPRGVHVTESIVVRAPREKVYAFWRSLSNLPALHDAPRACRVTSDTHSHWVTAGPAGHADGMGRGAHQ